MPPSASSTATTTPSAQGALAGPSLTTAYPTASKSIGHTSYVLKLTLDGGNVAVFKPRSRLPLGDRRYRSEIAAYRLARALGLPNVPRAEARSFPIEALRKLQADLDAKALPDPDGKLRGAIMPWIDQYKVLPLEQPSWRARWEPWLTDLASTIPADQRAIASATSTLLAFDYITGNWDRWSGANVAQDGASGMVLYVDNDGAFYDPPPADSLARQAALLQRVVRFSRRFVTALRALDETRLPGVFGEESPGQPLLPERVVSSVEARRKKVLAWIDARISDAGPEATLSFD